MKKFSNYLLFFLSLMAGSLNTYAQKDFFQGGTNHVNIKEFNNRIDKMRKEVGVPGLSLAIISDNKVVFSNSYGEKVLGSGEKVNDETIFEACSVSKTLLVYVVQMLVQEKRFDIDKPMYQYLPYSELEHDSRYRRITPKMILSHSSGIENWKWLNKPDILEILADPGVEYVYSGEGYQYLAKVIEKVVGKSYEQYIREQIVIPMKLKHTFTSYDSTGNFPENYAIGHTGLGKRIEKWKNTDPVPAAGVHTEARDYATFLTTVFDGRHLSNESIRRMLTPITLVEKGTPTLYFGEGFQVFHNNQDTIVFHSGSNNGFKSLVVYSIVSRNGFVFFCNGDNGISMSEEISRASVNLDISPMFKTDIIPQYPNQAFALFTGFTKYKYKGLNKKIRQLSKHRSDSAMVKLLTSLSEMFWDEEGAVTEKLLAQGVQLYPSFPETHFLMGEWYMDNDKYDAAKEYFLKAKQDGYHTDECDEYIKECNKN